jgi:hypothetical protein
MYQEVKDKIESFGLAKVLFCKMLWRFINFYP